MQGLGPQKPISQPQRAELVRPETTARELSLSPPREKQPSWTDAVRDAFVKKGPAPSEARSDEAAMLDRAHLLRSHRRSRAEDVEASGPPTGNRPEHVRSSMIEAHQDLIAKNPAGVKDKFDKLEESAFVFFRGTADLYYRDLAGKDADQPRVLSNGDVHPENFGIMKGADGKPVFGLNDFDEASHAPFTWDVKRGATGLEMAARERGLSPDQRKRIVEEFAESYVEALQDSADSKVEETERLTAQNSPKILEKLFQKANKADRKEFLEERVDLKRGKFLETDEIKPQSQRREEFQKAIDAYRGGLPVEARGNPEEFKVKDVAIKLDSGTGSLGTERYYALLEGKTRSPEDDIVLELKEARPSILQRYAGSGDDPAKAASEAARITAAGKVQVVGGDPLLGEATLGGKSFLARERSPLKTAAKLEKMNAEDLKDYAKVLGRTLGLAHARSDQAEPDRPGSAEGRILKAIDAKEFPEQIAAVASDKADQVQADYAAFLELQAKGAFQF